MKPHMKGNRFSVKAQDKPPKKKRWILSRQYLQPLGGALEDQDSSSEDQDEVIEHNTKLKCAYEAAIYGMKEGFLTGVFLGGCWGIFKNIRSNMDVEGSGKADDGEDKKNEKKPVAQPYKAVKDPKNENTNKTPLEPSSSRTHSERRSNTSSFRERTPSQNDKLEAYEKSVQTVIQNSEGSNLYGVSRTDYTRVNSFMYDRFSVKGDAQAKSEVSKGHEYYDANRYVYKRRGEKVEIVGYAFIQTGSALKDATSFNDSIKSDDSDTQRKRSGTYNREDKEGSEHSQNRSKTSDASSSKKSGEKNRTESGEEKEKSRSQRESDQSAKGESSKHESQDEKSKKRDSIKSQYETTSSKSEQESVKIEKSGDKQGSKTEMSVRSGKDSSKKQSAGSEKDSVRSAKHGSRTEERLIKSEISRTESLKNSHSIESEIKKEYSKPSMNRTEQMGKSEKDFIATERSRSKSGEDRPSRIQSKTESKPEKHSQSNKAESRKGGKRGSTGNRSVKSLHDRQKTSPQHSENIYPSSKDSIIRDVDSVSNGYVSEMESVHSRKGSNISEIGDAQEERVNATRSFVSEVHESSPHITQAHSQVSGRGGSDISNRSHIMREPSDIIQEDYHITPEQSKSYVIDSNEERDMRHASYVSQRSVFDHTSKRSSVMEGASQRSSVMEDASQRGSVMEGASKRSSVMEDASQRGSVMEGASKRSSVMEDASQRGSVMEGASKRSSVMEDASQRGSTSASKRSSAVDRGSRQRSYLAEDAEAVDTRSNFSRHLQESSVMEPEYVASSTPVTATRASASPAPAETAAGQNTAKTAPADSSADTQKRKSARSSILQSLNENVIVFSACNCAIVLGVICSVISTTRASLTV